MKLWDATFYSSTAVLVVLGLLFILGSVSRSKLYEKDLSLAPENLSRAGKSFQLQLKVEQNENPSVKLSESKSMAGLQEKLDSYAMSLKVLKSQERTRSHVVNVLYLVSSIVMLVSSIFRKKNQMSSSGKSPSVKRLATHLSKTG